MKNTHVMQVKAFVKNLDRVNTFVRKALEEAKLPEKKINETLLAVEEIFINIARYAYPENTNKLVKIVFEMKDKFVRLTIIDNGLAFNPIEASQPDIKESIEVRKVGGLGIYLTKKMADRLVYRRQDGSNYIVLEKDL